MLSISGSWLTAEAGYDWMDTHFMLGYFSLGLIAFRLLWGFFGSHYARFGQFVRGPRAVWQDVAQLFRRNSLHAAGHSAIGGWSVLLLLSLVAVQATTGLFISDDIMYAGPYNPAISGDLAGSLAFIHHNNFNLLLGFVGLHVLAVLWHQWGKRSNVLPPMLHGYRRDLTPPSPVLPTYTLRALLLIGLCALAVTLLVWLAPEPQYDSYF